MVGTDSDSELRDLNSTPEQQQDRQLSLQNSKDSLWMNMEEFLSSMFLADGEDQGTSSNDQQRQCPFNIPKLLLTKPIDEAWSEIFDSCDSNDQGQQTKNPASPKAFGNITLENFLARAGIVTDDVQEPPPQQTRYEKGIKERRRLRIVKNRELAAQFRANKQAYNLQLEQELYLQKYEEELARAKAVMQPKANEKPTTMRRVFSSPC